MEDTMFTMSGFDHPVSFDVPVEAGVAVDLSPRWRMDGRLTAATLLLDAIPEAIVLFVCTPRVRFGAPALSRAAVNPLMREWLSWVGEPLWTDLELAAQGVAVAGCSAKSLHCNGLDVRVVTWSAPTGATRRPLIAARWSLTDRQADVIELLAEGHTNKAIAGLLSISEATVELHITRLLCKTGSENRATLVAAFWRVR